MASLPLKFLERLKMILPQEVWGPAMESFSRAGPLSVRINTLKADRQEILSHLEQNKIQFKTIPWYQDALTIENFDQKQLGETTPVKNGLIYSQGLSSMLPVLALDPQPNEKILDMCAAPGSKTTQMAAHMRNQGSILAVEAIKDRYYRLRSVVTLLGAKMIDCKIMDARRLRFEGEYFDRILVDAPCSSDGRFKIANPKTFAFWSPRKIREMVQKQRGLLMTASHLLKPGGDLVYSTCTFAPEENEGVVNWLLRKTKVSLEVVPLEFSGIKTYPAINQWQGKEFDQRVKHCLRVLPDDKMEGFFIAKFRRQQ